MPLHPQVRAMLEAAEDSGLPPLHELDPPAARKQAAQANELVEAGPELPLVEELSIPTSEGEIAARRYVPDAATASAGAGDGDGDGEGDGAVIVWIHGGGWVIGDLDSHDPACRLLALESGCEVISLDYRRAPEHPFPAPLEDCWDALRWVADRTGGRPLVLGGDSAGGNLAAVCALRARDRGGPALALQVLVYPVTDCDLDTASYRRHGDGPETYLTTDEMRWFWRQYAPDPGARANPEASPLRAADHSGVAPAIVLTAEYDPLRDDGLAYVEALRRAGVPVSHHHYEDMIHSFFALATMLDRGRAAVAELGREIHDRCSESGSAAVRSPRGRQA